MSKGQVLITGIGVVTKHGDLEHTWTAAEMRHTKPAPARASRGYQLENYQVLELQIETGQETVPGIDDNTDPTVRHAVVAGGRAAADAGLAAKQIDKFRAGVFVGSSRGTEWTRTRYQESLAKGESLPEDACLRTMFSAAAVALGNRLGFRGPNITHSSTCASSALAIIVACQYLKAGLIDVAVAGGTESCLTPAYIRQTATLGILSRTVCRPFDVARDGTWLGEGAAFFILESREHAVRRGAKAKAILAGASTACDGAVKGNDRRGETLEWTIRDAITNAGLVPSAISSISAHAPGTRIGDALEARALQRVFAENLSRIQVNSLKPVTGHCVGASASIETALTIHGMSKGLFLPTAMTENVDPSLHLNVPLVPEPLRGDAILKTCSGLGGIHSALVLTYPD